MQDPDPLWGKMLEISGSGSSISRESGSSVFDDQKFNKIQLNKNLPIFL
jgi:hypothetical protein